MAAASSAPTTRSSRGSANGTAQRSRRAWPLTVRGVGALVLGAAFLVLANQLGIPALIPFGLLMLALVVAATLSLRFGSRVVRVTRLFAPETGSVGTELAVTVRLDQRQALPSSPGTWHDTLPGGLVGHADGELAPMGSGRRTLELTYRAEGVRRGVHAIGPLVMTGTDPFGIARRRTVLGERTPVTIVPALVELAPLAVPAGAGGGSDESTTDRLGQGADNLIPRPYAPGDSTRRIHWRASAHRGEFMVREEEQQSAPRATVVLDRSVGRWGQQATRGQGGEPGFEAAVTATVSAAWRLALDGYAVEVIDGDGEPLAELTDDEALLGEMLTFFATVATRGDDTFEALPALLNGRSAGPFVFIGGRVDPSDAAALAPLAARAALPVAWAVAPTGDALERLEDAGWQAARLDPDEGVAAAWAESIPQGAGFAGG